MRSRALLPGRGEERRLDQVIGAPVTAEATSANHMDVPVPIEETDWHFVEATPGALPPALGDFPPVPADVYWPNAQRETRILKPNEGLCKVNFPPGA